MPFQFRKEAIEEDLNTNFPSQGQGNPPLYYSLSEVVVPTYSINNVTEGSTLPENLQTAWDFSTGAATCANTTVTLINNTGFWKVDLTLSNNINSAAEASVRINDGLATKIIWRAKQTGSSSSQGIAIDSETFFVYLRSGDSLELISNNPNYILAASYRQVADINGNLVNPLGFSAA